MPTILQAGAIAVRVRQRTPEVLIVRAKKNPTDWIFPKGHIEPGEDGPAAAVRELLEEGGVVGRAEELVGVSRLQIGAREVQVSYYLVWFEADGIAHERRESAWVPFPEARARLTYEDARRYLDLVLPRVAPMAR